MIADYLTMLKSKWSNNKSLYVFYGDWLKSVRQSKIEKNIEIASKVIQSAKMEAYREVYIELCELFDIEAFPEQDNDRGYNKGKYQGD